MGDCFHNYPSTDYDFYFKNTMQVDNTKTITDGAIMPVYLGFGNHDYDMRHAPREMSNRLFKAKYSTELYSVVDYKELKFINLNNFLGSTQDNTASDFNPNKGLSGEEQPNWFEGHLKHKPTFIFVPYPVVTNVAAKVGDYGLQRLLKKCQESIQLVVLGHLHK
jgi:hypothetical protein